MENTECMNLEEGDHAQPEEQTNSKKPYSFTVVPFKIEPHLEFIDFSKEGHLLLGSSNLVGKIWSGSVWFFDSGDVTPLEQESLSGHGCDSCVSAGKFLDTWDKIIIGEDSGKVTICSIAKFEDDSTHFLPQHGETQHDGCITSIAVLKDKMYSVSAGSDLKINVWDNNSLEIQHKYSPAHSMEITNVSSSLDEGVIFSSCSLDGSALLWDLKQSKPASAISQHEFGLTSIAWKDNNTVLAGSIAGEVIYFDIRNRKEINRLTFDKHPVHKVTICSDQGLLAVCGNSNTLKVWDINSLELVYTDTEHRGFIRDLSWNPINNKLYSCGFDKRIFSHIVPSSAEKDMLM